jgi:hypothetical protein
MDAVSRQGQRQIPFFLEAPSSLVRPWTPPPLPLGASGNFPSIPIPLSRHSSNRSSLLEIIEDALAIVSDDSDFANEDKEDMIDFGPSN